MPACPQCGSTDAVHKDKFMEEKNDAVFTFGVLPMHGMMPGNPLGLLIAAGCFAVAKLRHLAAKTWKCRKCRHEFS